MTTFEDTVPEALLRRIAEALERMAAAEERRNELIEAEAVERREAWAATQAQQAETFAAIVGLDPRAVP